MKRVYRLPGEDQKPPSNRDDGRSHGDAMPGIFDSSVPELHKAARKGDKAKVEHLLQKPDTVYRDSKQRTALHYASAYGHPEVVRLLIHKKFDLNAWDSDHDTALIKAVKCYEEDCVSILLEHGANPNIANAKGNTALHYAVYSSKSSLAAKLLSHGADAEAKNKEGLTPLWLALREKRMETATLLKKTGTKNVVNEPERLVLKEEDKKKSLEEKCLQEVETKQQLEISYATLEMEFKASEVNQLTEAQDQGTSSVQHDEKMEEPLDRIELEYLRLKENVKSLEMEILSLKKKMKKPAGKLERAWKHLSNDRESVNDPCAETFCVPQPGLEFTVPLQGGLMVTLTLLTQPPE